MRNSFSDSGTLPTASGAKALDRFSPFLTNLSNCAKIALPLHSPSKVLRLGSIVVAVSLSRTSGVQARGATQAAPSNPGDSSPFDALSPLSPRQAQLYLPVTELREALRDRPVIQALADKIMRRLSAKEEDPSASIVSISPLSYHGPFPIALLQATTRAEFVSALAKMPIELRDLWLRQALNAEYPARTQEFSTAMRLQLLSFNVWGLPSFGGLGGGESSRYPRIAAELARSPAGVIALQEMWDRRTTQIIHDSGFSFVSSGGPIGKLHGNSGLVTLSRYPILKHDFFAFTQRPGLERAVAKGVLFTRVELDQNTAVDIYNTHLASGSYGILGWFANREVSHQARISQLSELESWRQSHRTPGIPSVTVGDMNIDQEDSLYGTLPRLLGVDAYRARYPLNRYARSVSIFSEPEVIGATVDPCTNRWAKWKRHQPQRLDQIWLSDLDPLRTALGIRRCFVAEPLSDHYGLEMELIVSPESRS